MSAVAGSTVQVVVQAQTQEALAAVKTFSTQSKDALDVLSAGSKKVAADAGKASEHIRGMAYYFRSGIDSVRFALAGGGERAGFYAIDEAVRGLISSGMKLGTLVPILGALGAAAGASVLVWHEWNKAQEEAEQHAKDLASAWKELPGLIDQISKMQQTGLLSPAAAAEYSDYATGRKRLYIDSQSGQITRSATTQVPLNQAKTIPSTVPQDTPWNALISVPNNVADPASKAVQEWIKTNMTGAGGIADQQVAALADLDKESQRMEEERLKGIDKEKQAIINRYDTEREEMNKNLTLAKARLGDVAFDQDKSVQRAQADIAQSHKDQAAELAAIDQKADDEKAARWQKMVSDFSSGIMKGLEEQSKKQAKLDKQHEEELKKQTQLQQENQRAESAARLKEISGNPFLSTQEKSAYSIPVYQDMMAQNQQRIGDLGNIAATTNDQSAQLEAMKQIHELTVQQVDLQQKLNESYGASSWTYQLMAAVEKMRDIPTIQQQIGSLFQGVMQTGMNSIATNMTKVIEGTESWRKALSNIAESVLTQLLEGIIQIIEKQLVQLAIDVAIKAVTAGAFAEGGRPEVGKVALVGERGPELFVPDQAGTIIPAHQTASILQGRGDAGGFGSSTVEGHKVNLHFYDSRPHPRDYLSSGAGEQQIVDIARKNRTKIGVGT